MTRGRRVDAAQRPHDLVRPARPARPASLPALRPPMPATDPRVDAYVAVAPDFARPILAHLRDLVHQAVPDAVETMKWSRPHFEHHGLLAAMWAFRAHVAFALWRAAEVGASAAGADAVGADGMGQFGRIRRLEDLPPDERLVEWLRAAARLNEAGPRRRAAASKATARSMPNVPGDLRAALASSAAARATFEGFPPSHRREYLEWIVGAKRPETRARRVAQAVEWMAEGRGRNWKYERRAPGPAA